MKKIIYRKIAKDCMSFFLLTIFTISIIIWVIQAVNYLDFVTEDGHGFFVYFNYTLFSFPKILGRSFPLAVFIAFAYILLKYENKNELLIFWNFGIDKITFIKFFLKFSLVFILLNLILNTLVTPFTQNKARDFIRSSDLNFFESMLKPKKFIDIIQDLTIYFDEESEIGELKNIFINDKINKDSSKITYAKTGTLSVLNNKKILTLYNGVTINNNKGKISEFKFSKTNFNISKFETKTMTNQKTQENSSFQLIKCLSILNKIEKNTRMKIGGIPNCTFNNLKNIYKELYSRLIKPLYITFLIMISLLLILKSNNDHTFKIYKLKIYSLGFLSIIFLEISSKYISLNIIQNLFMSFLPFISVLLFYFYFLKVLKFRKI